MPFIELIPPANAAYLVGDPTDWFRQEPLPVQAGVPLRLSVPRGAWLEYAWLDSEKQPFAPEGEHALPTTNPWYAYARGTSTQAERWQNHPLWDGPAPELGETLRLSWQSEIFASRRRVSVHLPFGYAGESLPIFYVQDGVAFSRVGRLPEAAERARKQGCNAAIFVCIEPNDRNEEYYLNPLYARFLLEEVLPRVEGGHPEGLQTPLKAAWRGLWGASLGGLISLDVASRHPEWFSAVASHSGAFLAEHGNIDEKGEINVSTAPETLRLRLQAAPPRHLRVAMDTGLLEWLAPANRRMAATLFEGGVEHQYREYSAGHNWMTWQRAIPEALLYLLGPQN